MSHSQVSDFTMRSLFVRGIAAVGFLFFVTSAQCGDVELYWYPPDTLGPFKFPFSAASRFAAKSPQVSLPVREWVIDHPKGFVVIDTGLDEVTRRGSCGNLGTVVGYCDASTPTRRREDVIDAQLKKLGNTTKKVRAVISWRSGLDHIGNLDMFPNAYQVQERKKLMEAWHPSGTPYQGFVTSDNDESRNFYYSDILSDYDVFGDGTIVLVPSETGSFFVKVKISADTYITLTKEELAGTTNVERNVLPIGSVAHNPVAPHAPDFARDISVKQEVNPSVYGSVNSSNSGNVAGGVLPAITNVDIASVLPKDPTLLKTTLEISRNKTEEAACSAASNKLRDMINKVEQEATKEHRLPLEMRFQYPKSLFDERFVQSLASFPIVQRAVDDLVAAVQQFDNKCTIAFEESGRRGAAPVDLLSSIGAFAIKAGDFWDVRCTGTRVSRSLVLLAQHCLYDAKSGKERFKRDLDGNFTDDLRFFLAGDDQDTEGLKVKMEVAAVVTGTRSEIRIRDDYTLVKVVGGRAESNIARLTINPGALRPGRLLYLAGYFPTLNLRHRPKSARDVRNNFRVSTPWTCFSSKVENRCLYHGCQARSGVSGAPLVQIAQNGLSLVGIHVGPSGNGRGCDDKDESGRGGNVAVVLPDKVSDIIQRNDQDDVEGDYWSTHKMNKWYK